MIAPTLVKPRLWSAFVVSLLGVQLITAPASAETVSSRSKLPPGTPAFGFSLGQSYGTSVVSFPNGTMISVAMVPGTAIYTDLMENMLQRQTHPHPWLSFEGITARVLGCLDILKRSLGFGHRHDARAQVRILGDMLAALKTASETALQIPVEAVAVAAPWMQAWEDQWATQSTVNKALVHAGLQPWTWFSDGPAYLDDMRAVLASEGLWLCPGHWCTPHWMEVEEDEAANGERVLFISFTNQSLYTSIHILGCYFTLVGPIQPPSLAPNFGLDQESHAPSSADFFGAMQRHILSQIEAFSPEEIGPFTILAVGEAANNVHFRQVVRAVADEISKMETTTTTTTGQTGVQVLLPEDSAYASARGAAIWQRTKMNVTYCDDYNAKHGIVPQEGTENAHEEL